MFGHIYNKGIALYTGKAHVLKYDSGSLNGLLSCGVHFLPNWGKGRMNVGLVCLGHPAVANRGDHVEFDGAHPSTRCTAIA